MASLLSAAIRQAVEGHLARAGFLAVATRILSSGAGNADGLNPLIAFYPGFGTPVTVAPSPSPQLVDAIIMSGADRVFSATSCFTTSYRDDLDGVETDLVMGKTVGVDLPELLQLVDELLKAIGDEVSLPASDHPLVRHTVAWPDLSCEPTDLPEVVIAKIPADDGPGTTVFRVHLSDICAPIEGVLEPFTSHMQIGTLSVFPSRFLPLVEHTPVRRLYPLGIGTDVTSSI